MDCQIIINKGRSYRLRVEVHVMLHHKCYQEMIMMVKLVMYGHWELYFMEWCVGRYHFSSRIQRIYISE